MNSDAPQEPAQPEYYLILHKVRGAPAFDIAHKLTIGSEEGWIIPTSGHRAYPHWHMRLAKLEGDVGQGYFESLLFTPLPPALPDHYFTNDAPRKAYSTTLADLGLE